MKKKIKNIKKDIKRIKISKVRASECVVHLNKTSTLEGCPVAEVPSAATCP